MTDAARAREIAEGLTHTTRCWILHLADEVTSNRAGFSKGGFLAARLGLTEWDEAMKFERLTPLGLAVAEILKERT